MKRLSKRPRIRALFSTDILEIENGNRLSEPGRYTRLEALRKTGAIKAEVIRLTHLTEEQEKAFRIADNRTSEFAEWDKNLLEKEMREINADDWKEFGFDNKIIERVAAPNMCTCPKCGKQFMKI